MKKKTLSLVLTAVLFSTFAWLGCSTDDTTPTIGSGGGGDGDATDTGGDGGGGTVPGGDDNGGGTVPGGGDTGGGTTPGGGDTGGTTPGGGTPGSICDGATVDCYNECFGCAMSEPSLCGGAYTACQENAACAAYETCRNDNCVTQNLTGDAWVTCETNCRNAADATGVALYEAFEECINCDACKLSCGSQEGIYCSDVVCDGTPCYTECWGCAMNTSCKSQVQACSASADCTGLDNCRNVNCVQPGLTGEAWVACENQCNADWAGGIALLNAYHTCIYCVGCPTSCAMDAAGKCK